MTAVVFEAAKVKALLFDLDGTLIDSTQDIAESANFLRMSLSLAPLPQAEIAAFIGDGVEKLVARLLGPDFQGDLDVEVKRFKAHYREHCVDHTRMYAGVEETLRLLAARGYKMAVVTNKPERISATILERLGVAGLFGSVVGGNSTSNKKPHPDPLRKACRDLRVTEAESCMIGDSHVDVESAFNAGLPSLALLGGIGDDRKMLEQKPSVVLEEFSQLSQLFLKGA
ncbi:MAG: HAD-IIIA family hydrolase [candidate division FCPU426 bacterium]